MRSNYKSRLDSRCVSRDMNWVSLSQFCIIKVNALIISLIETVFFTAIEADLLLFPSY